jgi:hypothetical protein
MTDLAALAGSVGATDMFVMRFVAADQLVNLDGYGRGSGWAGNICMDPTSEPWLTDLLRSSVSSHRSAVPSLLFGPYWSAEAVGQVVGDYVVIMSGSGVTSVDGPTVARAAYAAAATVGEISTAKRLADELEVSQSALGIASLPPAGLAETATAIARHAAGALSCEFAAVLVMAGEPAVWTADEGWRPAATQDEIITALLPVIPAAAKGLLVEQDTRTSPHAYPPLSAEDGLVSRCAGRLGSGGWEGLLVTAHAGGAPRGFTDLCQRVARTMAGAATPVLDAAILRERSRAT